MEKKKAKRRGEIDDMDKHTERERRAFRTLSTSGNGDAGERKKAGSMDGKFLGRMTFELSLVRMSLTLSIKLSKLSTILIDVRHEHM